MNKSVKKTKSSMEFSDYEDDEMIDEIVDRGYKVFDENLYDLDDDVMVKLLNERGSFVYDSEEATTSNHELSLLKDIFGNPRLGSEESNLQDKVLYIIEQQFKS